MSLGFDVPYPKDPKRYRVAQDEFVTGSLVLQSGATLGIQNPALYNNAPVGGKFLQLGSDGTVGCGAGGAGSGSVTSITAGTGLTGGTITAAGTITTNLTAGANVTITAGTGTELVIAATGGGGGGSISTINAGSGISVAGGTGPTATVTNTGVNSITAGSGITVTGTATVPIITATAGGGGTVTQVNTGAGLSGGPITGTGTLVNTGVTAIVAGTGIAVSGATGSVTVSAAVNPITTTSTLQFFGDSIALGTGATVTANRWTSVLCTALGKTENNKANAGSQWLDSGTSIYNNFTAGQTTFLSYGTNDVSFQYLIDAVEGFIKNAILYSCLPAANINNTRAGTKVGSWVNTPVYPTGSVTSTVDGTASLQVTTVSGRYVCWAVTIDKGTYTGPNVTNCVGYQVTIDGTVVTLNSSGTSSLLPEVGGFGNGLGGQPYGSAASVYDTGVVGTHTVKFSPNVINTPASLVFYIDWIGAFNVNQGSCNTVLVTDYGQHTSTYYTTPASDNLININYLLRLRMKRVTENFRNRYGLPVYFLEDAYTQDETAQLCTDLLHPNNNGHAAIAARVQQLLANPAAP